MTVDSNRSVNSSSVVATVRVSQASAATVEGRGALLLLRFSLFSAFLLSTATQFRFGPVGLGELFGLLAILLTIWLNLHFVHSMAKTVFSALFVLWIAIGIGGLLSMALGWAEVLPRDFLALVYAQLLAWSVLASATHDGQVVSSVLWSLVLFALAQVLVAGVSLTSGALIVWYGGDDGEPGVPLLNRFMGWSINPNQLGIALSALPFWILLFFTQSSGVVARGVAVASLLAAVGVAVLVQSNTVFFAWIVGGLGALLIVYRKYFLSHPIVVACLGLAASLTGAFFIEDLDGLLSKGEYDDYNGRSPLWTSALLAFARSPVFGLGPGAHADEGDGRGGFEAHSLFLDFATQGGVIAVVVLLVLILKSLRAAFSANSALVLGGVGATVVECLAHNTQRHPMFWLYLLLPLILISARERH